MHLAPYEICRMRELLKKLSLVKIWVQISRLCWVTKEGCNCQNLLENWDGTRHLLDVSWLYGLKNISFRNKTFLFFKTESWNFQVQFDIKIRETSQNFNSFSLFRQVFYFHIFYRLSDWVEILQGFTKFNFKLNLKVSAFYLEKQKKFYS